MERLKKEKLERKHSGACKAVKTLEEAVIDFQMQKEKSSTARELNTYRDSMIQRFEYSIDTTWKYLKDYF